MIPDRKLLEDAAKAAGLFSLLGWGIDSYAPYWLNDPKQPTPRYWNPLTDDGDSLRLAVKLRIKFRYNEALGQAIAWFGAPEEVEVTVNIEECGHDENAATRRAIVRAAAMKEGRND